MISAEDHDRRPLAACDRDRQPGESGRGDSGAGHSRRARHASCHKERFRSPDKMLDQATHRGRVGPGPGGSLEGEVDRGGDEVGGG